LKQIVPPPIMALCDPKWRVAMRRLISLMLLPLAACSTVQTADTVAVSKVALAELKRADGSDNGVATLSQRSDGLWLEVAATGLVAGSYGIHLHAIGKCEGPGFTTAGSHWNPAGKMHGFDNPMGAHVGDLRNLTVIAGGVGAMEAKIAGGDWAGAMDGDGLSIIIHEKPDDYSTDPSGNSGARVICGVFKGG
jgi:superoxide dismutase, Cu-Zn family